MGPRSGLSPLAMLGANSKVVSVSVNQLRWQMKAEARPKCPVSAVSLLGCWLDSSGDTVLVHTDRIFQLTATLLRPPRGDINLNLRETTDGRTWQCGEAVLDLERSSTEQLCWVFQDGSTSVWMWASFSLEAMAWRGLVLPQDALPPELLSPPSSRDTKTPSGPSTPGVEAEEWVPVCVPAERA